MHTCPTCHTVIQAPYRDAIPVKTKQKVNLFGLVVSKFRSTTARFRVNRMNGKSLIGKVFRLVVDGLAGFIALCVLLVIGWIGTIGAERLGIYVGNRLLGFGLGTGWETPAPVLFWLLGIATIFSPLLLPLMGKKFVALIALIGS